MTEKPYTETKLDSKPLEIGERVLADCQRRARELENRRPGAMTVADKRELHKLRVFLNLARTGSPASSSSSSPPPSPLSQWGRSAVSSSAPEPPPCFSSS
jgi:hypothetical protein